MTRLALLLTLGILSIVPGVARSQPYFPLELGNRWTYVIEHPVFSGDREVTVESEAAGLYLVRTRSPGVGADSVALLRAEDGDILIELEQVGLVPHYRFAEDSWTHRSPSGCDDEAAVTVEARDEVVETPAGVFADCLKLVFQGRCADAGLLAQWWAPGVGLVKSVEDNFAGPVTWLLTGVTLRERFRRGDANSDGSVDITDMIYLLAHLFGGGPGPRCADVGDVNDDGRVDIADPVFGLEHLFAGGAEPPAPGPRVPGFDGTPTDAFTCGDPPPSALPGVSFDLSGNPDTITLAEAAAGVVFHYEVVIDDDIEGVVSMPLDAGRCDQPHESGLRILERIAGGGELYCLCDMGLCLPMEGSTTLPAGRYGGSFEWTGRNWRGPSDTGNPMGDSFPPGTYRFEIRAEGLYRTAEACDECEEPFSLRAAVEFDLVP